MDKKRLEILNTKRDKWYKRIREEFETLYPNLKEFNDDLTPNLEYAKKYMAFMNKTEEYKKEVEVKEGVFEELTFTRLVRPMPIFTVSQKELEEAYEKSDEFKKNVQLELMELCDSKQIELQSLVLDYKATPLQLERYKDKYERAKAGEFDTKTNEIIIQNHEAYLKTIRGFVDLIEAFRSNVDDLIIEGKLVRARELIRIGKTFGVDTKKEDIENLFKGGLE